MHDDSSTRPTVTLGPGRDKRVRSGHPWVYSNEVVMDAAAKALAPGTVVTLLDAAGRPIGVATFNPHSLICARLLDQDAALPVDSGLLAARLRAALELRERLFPSPFYRLAHAESDALPGLVIDRYGDVLACQLNTAGMERLLPDLMDALDAVLAPRAVVLRNDATSRTLEGLESYVRVARGAIDGPLEIEENGCIFLADLAGGQKTGWFYDQRDNRAFVAKLSTGRRVLDVYSYTGGFAVQAAAAGAAEVVAVDRSEAALELAAAAAARNGVGQRCRFVRGQAFAEMTRLADAGEHFEVVIVDPPAFVKSRKDLAAAVKGYRKLARLAARLVAPRGILFVASCSHHLEPEAFLQQIRRGLTDAKRTGRFLRSAGAGADHPAHAFLPETAYLKAHTLQLD
jgi:23S rRNA (cytosine1962-C5)-methyltransferase